MCPWLMIKIRGVSMLAFSIKFMKSMFTEWWKELIFVVIGLSLCICIILNVAESFFGYSSPDWGESSVSQRDDFEYYNNRINFEFSDTTKIKEVIEEVQKIEGVNEVYLKCTNKEGFEILAGTHMPRITEDGMMTGYMPDKLKDGEVVVSYSALSFIASNGIETGKEFVAVGESFRLGNVELGCAAETSLLEYFIVSVNDFKKVYEDSGIGDVTMYYIYEEGFTEQQKKEVKEVVEKVKVPKKVEQQDTEEGVQWSVYFKYVKEWLLGLAIAILNALFLYVYILERRIPAYSVLKLQGLSNRVLCVLLLMGIMLIYMLAFLIAGMGHVIYSLASGNILYNTVPIYLYTFMLVMSMCIVVFFVTTWKLVKRQPFEIYSYR